MAPVASNTTPTFSNHGNPDLVCTPTHWSTILLFFAANYVAHCLTIKFYPAETLKEKAIAVAGALLFPASGLSRAIEAIRQRSRLRKVNPIERALIAGALCMVVRSRTWRPHENDVLRNIRSSRDVSYKIGHLAFEDLQMNLVSIRR
jgi:hypothetical protein